MAKRGGSWDGCFQISLVIPTWFWASACLKAEENFVYDSNSDVDSCKLENAKQEYDKICRGYLMPPEKPFLCIVAVRREAEIVVNVIGTLNFQVKYKDPLERKNYPEELVNPPSSTDRESGLRYGTFTRVAVDKCARQQGVAKRMLSFVIEYAKETGSKGALWPTHIQPSPFGSSSPFGRPATSNPSGFFRPATSNPFIPSGNSSVFGQPTTSWPIDPFIPSEFEYFGARQCMKICLFT